MAYFVEETEEGQKVYKTHTVHPKNLNVFNSELSLRILEELSKKPQCAMDIARKLKQHEQKIYYHLRRLEKAKIIKLVRTEERVGGLAKIFSVPHPFLTIKLFEGEHLLDVKTKPKELEFFKPFVENGRMNSIIIVGSPDPHGRFGAQASDGYAAIDLSLLLGTFLNNVKPNYMLDTHLRESDLQNNLILLGGPKTNIYLDKINKKLPIYFDEKHEWTIVSTLSKSIYTADEVGIIIKMKNPFAKDKEILILSGRRFTGTRAAVLGIIKYLKKIEEGNKFDSGIARVVRGIDRDADGRIDDVEFLE